MLTILWNQGFIRPLSGGGGGFVSGRYTPRGPDMRRLDKEKRLRQMQRDEKDMLELTALIIPNLL